MLPQRARGKRFQPTLPARGATHNCSFYRFFCTDFNPRSPHGERRQEAGAHVKKGEFQPTLPARGATTSKGTMPLQSPFQPTLPARGATLSMSCCTICPENFNPRSPHGERRGLPTTERGQIIISTHAPRTGSDKVGRGLEMESRISTHAPRTGSDRLGRGGVFPAPVISTHAPRTGSDNVPGECLTAQRLFQPTLPARGATPRDIFFPAGKENFNPRSPHGERRVIVFNPGCLNIISTHAPRTGSDFRTQSPFSLPP